MTWSRNICCSEFRHMQLLSSLLLSLNLISCHHISEVFYHWPWVEVLNMSQEHEYSTLESWDWSLLNCSLHLALPLYCCSYSLSPSSWNKEELSRWTCCLEAGSTVSRQSPAVLSFSGRELSAPRPCPSRVATSGFMWIVYSLKLL